MVSSGKIFTMSVDCISNSSFVSCGPKTVNYSLRVAALIAGLVLATFAMITLGGKNWLVGALFTTGSLGLLTFAIFYHFEENEPPLIEEVYIEPVRVKATEVVKPKEKKEVVHNRYGALETPLFIAAKRGEVDKIESLLNEGHFYFEDRAHVIPMLLRFAIRPGSDMPIYIDCIKKLMAKGADIKAQNYEGDTVLHVARRLQRQFALQDDWTCALIAIGAQKEGKNRHQETSGQTEQLYAEKGDSQALVPPKPATAREELEWQVKVKEYVPTANVLGNKRLNNAELLLCWLDQGFKIAHRPDLLHWAINWGLEKTAIELINKSAINIESVDKKGLASLALAMRAQRKEVIPVLIAKGANQSARYVHYYSQLFGYQLT